MIKNLKISKLAAKIYASVRRRFTVSEQVFFSQRLAFLINAGIPMVTALGIIRDSTKDIYKAKVIEALIDDVSGGQYLSKSMAKWSSSFSAFLVHIIYIGETSGTLSKNLEYVAEELNKKYALQGKIRGALFYPVFICIATAAITGTLVLYIFPKIMPVFKSMKITLPWSTRIVIFISGTLLSHPWLTAGVLLVFFFGAVMLVKKVPVISRMCSRLLFAFPVTRKIVVSYNLAHLCRTLGLLLQSGVSVGSALHISSDTLKNSEYKKACIIIIDHVQKGTALSTGFVNYKHLFPALMVSMVAVGETTGRLSDTFMYLAKLYEQDVESFTKTLSSSIEPFLMLLMGCIVGFVALSIITPIYEVTQNLR